MIRKRRSRSLTWVVLLALVMPVSGISRVNAQRRPPLPEILYVQDHNVGELFRVDLSDFKNKYKDFAAARDGHFTIRLSKAIFSDSNSQLLFPFSHPPVPEDVFVVGSTAKEVANSTGRNLGDVQAWEDLFSYTLTRTPTAVSATASAGPDTFSIVFPWEVVTRDVRDLPPDSLIGVSVNGTAVDLEPSVFFQLATTYTAKRGDLSDVRLPDSFGILSASFSAKSRFANAAQAFLFAVDKIQKSYEIPPISGPLNSGCVGPCLQCGGNLLLSLGTSLALIAACGGALATGGSTAALCVGAFIVHWGQQFVTIGSCLSCSDCMAAPPGIGDGGSGGTAGGTCDQGWHDCCNNQCCNNDNPPSCCNPPCPGDP